jgi:adenine-specific DNA methylase
MPEEITGFKIQRANLSIIMEKEEIAEQLDILHKAPTTRYQGSKRSLLPWIYENLKSLPFETVLDGFGGTGSVSYLFKLMNKKVTFNDILPSNCMTGLALIENDSVTLDEEDLGFISHRNGFEYPTFIEDAFKGIYYTTDENRLLDVMALNIRMLSEKYKGDILTKKQALAYHVLFQACLCKRPFNLFHRKNLSLRTARDVKRSFGNKKTWNTGFGKLIKRFNEEVTNKVFSNGFRHEALSQDIIDIKNRKFDLVYIDPPYARIDDKTPKDYHELYHFLDGMVDYDNWAKKINLNTKNKRLVKQKNHWNEGNIEDNFKALFEKFKDSIIVVSYGEPGSPSIYKIKKLLLKYKSKVRIAKKEYKYKLNHRNGHGLYEVLIIGE